MFWKLLSHIALCFEVIPSDLSEIMKDPYLRIQTGEWVDICLTIVVLFFEKFDMSLYLMRIGNDDRDNDSKNMNVPKQMIQRIYLSLRGLLEGEASHIIGGSLAEEITITINTLFPHIDFEDIVDLETSTTFMDSKVDPHSMKQIKMRRKRDSVIYEDIQQITYRNKYKDYVNKIKKRYSYHTTNASSNYFSYFYLET